jgi:ribonucleotide monophosphatase NagD (HAD superfamily)
MSKTVCFDFDGTLATYEGWQGSKNFGDPIPETVETVRLLKKMGWKIIIFTTREETEDLRQWLADNDVPYDEINKNSENPPNTSTKPLADVFVDDRAVNYHGQDRLELMSEILKVVEEAG